MNKKSVLLPGLNEQFRFLLHHFEYSENKILFIGSGISSIAKKLAENNKIEIIVDNYDSLINTKLALDKVENVQIKIMSFENTDFENEHFDLVFTQASISTFDRKNIVKEIKRILKPNGVLCIGETVKLKQNVPSFVNDIFESSNIDPIEIDKLEKYYTERNFDLIDSKDLTHTLKEFYSQFSGMLKNKSEDLTEREKSYYKKVMNQIKHESNAYLKLGADKFIGFKTLILKKK